LRFGRLWERLGAQGESDQAYERLAEAYGEPGRAYHTLAHVLDCLARLDEAAPPDERRDLVEAAIWFHDVVYDSRRTDNEERSAEWAADALGSAGAAVTERVADLIRATAHATPPRDPESALLCDIDLSILGRTAEEFDEYQRRIREEYAWVPAPLYRAGRTRILGAFLQRERLYLTSYFRDRYESAARENLRRALAEPA
jgi:predicted metal-dependent HD superfamily phosphohydrolase